MAATVASAPAIDLQAGPGAAVRGPSLPDTVLVMPSLQAQQNRQLYQLQQQEYHSQERRDVLVDPPRVRTPPSARQSQRCTTTIYGNRYIQQCD